MELQCRIPIRTSKDGLLREQHLSGGTKPDLQGLYPYPSCQLSERELEPEPILQELQGKCSLQYSYQYYQLSEQV